MSLLAKVSDLSFFFFFLRSSYADMLHDKDRVSVKGNYYLLNIILFFGNHYLDVGF